MLAALVPTAGSAAERYFWKIDYYDRSLRFGAEDPTDTSETMRVLTIIATVFIPLTFIVGVYGMNFGDPNNPWAMPELRWTYGYPSVWLAMVAVAAGMIYLFKRNKWF